MDHGISIQKLPLTYLTNCTLYLQRKESDKKRHIHEEEEYTRSRGKEVIKGKGGFVTFTKHLKYLGGYISYSHQGDYDIDARLASGNESMGALNKFWTDDSVDNRSKHLIFLAIPINLLPWGCER